MIHMQIDIGQVPGHAPAVKGTVTTMAPDGTVLKLRVRKYGNTTGSECENTGPEFNPLAEFVYGKPNPYADPKRGRLDDVTIDTTTSDVANTTEWNQAKFEQNLGGKLSIIGKSVVVLTDVPDKTGAITEAVMGCCVLG